MGEIRIILIWVFGLLAAGIFGGLVGNALYTGYTIDGAIYGFLAGLFSFACVRLWLSKPKSRPSLATATNYYQTLETDYEQAWADYRDMRYEAAMSAFAELAKKGNIYAQGIVGVQHAAEHRYQKDKGKPPYDPNETHKTLCRLNDAGDLEAIYVLSLLYSEGWGVRRDAKMAFRLNLRAAENGHVASQYHVAEAYEIGEGVKKDKNLAIKWYEEATAQGDLAARYRLEVLSK